LPQSLHVRTSLALSLQRWCCNYGSDGNAIAGTNNQSSNWSQSPLSCSCCLWAALTSLLQPLDVRNSLALPPSALAPLML
jgi:hypothetical protein